MEIHIHIHHEYNEDVLGKLDLIIKNQNKMADELATLTTEVEETNTVVDSAIVLLKGLKEKLDAAGTDPAKLKALSESLNSKQQEFADAIVANTPAAEPE